MRALKRIVLVLAAVDVAYRTAPVKVPGSRAYVRRSLGIA